MFKTAVGGRWFAASTFRFPFRVLLRCLARCLHCDPFCFCYSGCGGGDVENGGDVDGGGVVWNSW